MKAIKKTETKKSAIPQGVADAFKANPETEFCFMNADKSLWFWNEITATKHFDEVEKVKNPHYKKITIEETPQNEK